MSRFTERLRAIKEPPATPAQRRAVYNMRLALGLPAAGVHDMTFSEAAKEIEEMKIMFERKKESRVRNAFTHDDPADFDLDDFGRRWES